MKIRKNYTCSLEVIHDFIKEKLKCIIIFQLRDKKCSFLELKRTINDISEKMLLEQLKEFKKNGFLDKYSYEGYPLKVEYFLTKKRKSFWKL